MSDLHKHARLGGSGGMLPQRKFLEIRCSETASEAILGQKQSRSSYLVHGSSIASNFWLHLLSQLTSNFHGRKY